MKALTAFHNNVSRYTAALGERYRSLQGEKLDCMSIVSHPALLLHPLQ